MCHNKQELPACIRLQRHTHKHTDKKATGNLGNRLELGHMESVLNVKQLGQLEADSSRVDLKKLSGPGGKFFVAGCLMTARLRGRLFFILASSQEVAL